MARDETIRQEENTRKVQSNLRAGGRPFLQAQQTKAQRDEDAFMQIHGGLGARLIYRLVEAFLNDGHRRSAAAGAKRALKKDARRLGSSKDNLK